MLVQDTETVKEILSALWKNLKPVHEYPKDRILDSSKYVRLAKKYKYSNYRLCLYQDLYNIGILDKMTDYQKRFIGNSGACIAIMNSIAGNPISVMFRSIQGKEFMDFSLHYLMYGIDKMSDKFRYGDPIVITEGAYDADSVRSIYSNAVAMQTSNINRVQADILNTMTDYFIVAFDSDKAGDTGYESAKKKLKGTVVRLQIYKGDKDVGVLEETESPSDYEKRYNWYQEQVHHFLSNSKVFL